MPADGDCRLQREGCQRLCRVLAQQVPLRCAAKRAAVAGGSVISRSCPCLSLPMVSVDRRFSKLPAASAAMAPGRSGTSDWGAHEHGQVGGCLGDEGAALCLVQVHVAVAVGVFHGPQLDLPSGVTGARVVAHLDFAELTL